MDEQKQPVETTENEPVKKKGIRPGTVITAVIVVLLVALILYFVICTFSHKVPMLFNHALLRIVSPSMDDGTENGIKMGDFILIRKITPEEVRVGNVITFYSDDPVLNGAPNTHRVIEIREEDGKLEFVTKGDNPRTNAVADQYTAKADKVVGLYIGKVKPLQFLGNLMKTPQGFLIVLMVPMLILMVVAGHEIVKKLKKHEKEQPANEAPAEDSEEMRRLIDAEIERMKAAGELPETGAREASKKPEEPDRKVIKEETEEEKDPIWEDPKDLTDGQKR